MSEVSILTISEAKLQAMLDEAVRRGIAGAAKDTGEELGVGDMARLIGVAERTVLNMEKRGELPARCGKRWLKADVLKWRHDLQ